ncbi:hypothetical protein GWL_45200 [Herbaspirillum sp. GW103]|nr:hypothetical protein GWL_45200 [Herbaspirillum sp. GW103]
MRSGLYGGRQGGTCGKWLLPGLYDDKAVPRQSASGQMMPLLPCRNENMRPERGGRQGRPCSLSARKLCCTEARQSVKSFDRAAKCLYNLRFSCFAMGF